MKQPINRFAAAALTAAFLSLPLASAALAQPVTLAANDTIDKAEQAVSDTWITSKVKSTFIADSSLSALDIKVETNQGVVSLSGVVASDAERDLAIAKTREIEGVRDVSADALKTAD
ncbi:BON domain-containing protein [Pseudomonas sp. NCCP-436]|uniref:BON domain-containing protein n=1 Tax=Pseudomonas sp. NCCP-436 TaxID=2842481 RepID=UPI001C7E5606|nr:BON domain-containing protein [Pseudomonas sp. NCCP-436]GIZ13614.1 BON domain-containing protein [Pseudomonas sp. NCCP-436]